MPPRNPAPIPMRMLVETLPDAPTPGYELPHNGLNDQQLELARSKGYVPKDIRFEKGQYWVELCSQGLSFGTVILNEQQQLAYDAGLKLYKEQRAVEKQPAALTDDVIDRLADIRPGKLADLLLHKTKPVDRAMPDPAAPLVRPPQTELEQDVADEVAKLLEEK